MANWFKAEGLDFADDIALLDVSLNGIQDLTSQVEDAAKLVGLCHSVWMLKKNKDDDFGYLATW